MSVPINTEGITHDTTIPKLYCFLLLTRQWTSSLATISYTLSISTPKHTHIHTHTYTHTHTYMYTQDSVADSERERHQKLVEAIGWFFFDLLLLGYVEDPETGLSFRIPSSLEWTLYIEVRRHQPRTQASPRSFFRSRGKCTFSHGCEKAARKAWVRG